MELGPLQPAAHHWMLRAPHESLRNFVILVDSSDPQNVHSLASHPWVCPAIREGEDGLRQVLKAMVHDDRDPS